MDNKEQVMSLLESIDTTIVSPFANEDELINAIHQLTDGIRTKLNKPQISDKAKQEFQLGDIAYMIDDDYRFFESEVYKIELDNGEYYYTTGDCDFESKDIDKWVFTSEIYREMHMQI